MIPRLISRNPIESLSINAITDIILNICICLLCITVITFIVYRMLKEKIV